MRCSEQIFTHGGATPLTPPELPFLAGGRNPFPASLSPATGVHGIGSTPHALVISTQSNLRSSKFGGNTDVKAKVEKESTEPENMACTWFGEICSCALNNSRNKFHQTT